MKVNKANCRLVGKDKLGLEGGPSVTVSVLMNTAPAKLVTAITPPIRVEGKQITVTNPVEKTLNPTENTLKSPMRVESKQNSGGISMEKTLNSPIRVEGKHISNVSSMEKTLTSPFRVEGKQNSDANSVGRTGEQTPRPTENARNEWSMMAEVGAEKSATEEPSGAQGIMIIPVEKEGKWATLFTGN